jgi:hypothetical protein
MSKIELTESDKVKLKELDTPLENMADLLRQMTTFTTMLTSGNIEDQSFLDSISE